MTFCKVVQVLAVLAVAFGSVQSVYAENAASMSKEWSKSGFGNSVTYRCRQPSCGGEGSMMKVQSFGVISGAPDLGIPDGSNVEAEFRRRPEVRRILAAMLQQLTRQAPNKGSKITTTYFANQSYAGFNFSLVGAGKKDEYSAAQLRIKGNRALLAISEAESPQIARRNFNSLLNTLSTD